MQAEQSQRAWHMAGAIDTTATVARPIGPWAEKRECLSAVLRVRKETSGIVAPAAHIAVGPLSVPNQPPCKRALRPWGVACGAYLPHYHAYLHRPPPAPPHPHPHQPRAPLSLPFHAMHAPPPAACALRLGAPGVVCELRPAGPSHGHHVHDGGAAAQVRGPAELVTGRLGRCLAG